MIIIKKTSDYNAECKIEKGTENITILLGAEMLIEHLVEVNGNNIDDVLEDIKRIYMRDKEEENK